MALSEQQIAQVWVNQGGDPKYARLMAKLAKRESGGDPTIDNSQTGPGGGKLNKNGTVDTGLYAVNDVWRKDPVVGPLFRSGAIRTAAGSTKAAIHILKVQGPKAWATYNQATDSKYLGGFSGAATGSPATQAPAQVRTTTPGVDNSALRAQAVQQFLGSKNSDPVSFAMQIRNAQDVPGKTSVVPSKATGVVGAGGSPDTAKLVSRANALDRKNNAGKLPYLYGGGHQGGRINAYTNSQPLDCSAAVSTVLGINPKVSGQFETFGKPGDGGNQGVTIAANGHHVLMKIDGHWWGTSASNPGGGAGWIPQSQISPAYLKGFTLRHA